MIFKEYFTQVLVGPRSSLGLPSANTRKYEEKRLAL